MAICFVKKILISNMTRTDQIDRYAQNALKVVLQAEEPIHEIRLVIRIELVEEIGITCSIIPLCDSRRAEQIEAAHAVLLADRGYLLEMSLQQRNHSAHYNVVDDPVLPRIRRTTRTPAHTSTAHGATRHNPITIICKLHPNPLPLVARPLRIECQKPSSAAMIDCGVMIVTSTRARAPENCGALVSSAADCSRMVPFCDIAETIC